METQGPALDAELTAARRATGDALLARIQGELYFAVLYNRFVDPAGWLHQQDVVKGLALWLLRPSIRGDEKLMAYIGRVADRAGIKLPWRVLPKPLCNPP